MEGYLKNDNIVEDRVCIDGIPAIIFRPTRIEKLYPTIIFYHGWGSNKENQRFRAFILSTLGYQVIVPDGIYHGERNLVDYEDINNMELYFWDTVFSNIDEFPNIVDRLVKEYNGDPNRIGVSGNSMGGFTAAGIFTHNPNIKALVVFNGSCAWSNSNKFFMDTFNLVMGRGSKGIENKVSELDPINNLQKLKNRPILMLHGEDDTVVSMEAQRFFYDKAKGLYEDEKKIELTGYPNLNHFVTTNMMEECVSWFCKYI